MLAGGKGGGVPEDRRVDEIDVGLCLRIILLADFLFDLKCTRPVYLPAQE